MTRLGDEVYAELEAAREEVKRLTHELVEARAALDRRGIRCGTGSAAIQRAVLESIERLGRTLPCGHTLGDLTWAPGTVTSCGACRSERAKKRPIGQA